MGSAWFRGCAVCFLVDARLYVEVQNPKDLFPCALGNPQKIPFSPETLQLQAHQRSPPSHHTGVPSRLVRA